MGHIFGKPKAAKKKPIVTEQDRAILQLKQQRDRVKQYQKRILIQLENEREIARQLMKNNRKDKALLLLKKKKYMESVLDKTDNQLMTLERLAMDIEFSEVEKTVVEGLKAGNQALQQLHQILSIEQIESILDETKEGIDKQREIDELLLGMNADQDEQSLLSDLNDMLGITQTIHLPDVPQQEIVDDTEKVKKQKSRQVALES